MRRFRLSTLRLFIVLFLLAAFGAIVMRWISLERWRWRELHQTDLETDSRPLVVAESSPKPTRPPVISGKLETARLFNGVTVRSTLETPPGAAASAERVDPESYVLDLKLQARVPTPNKTIDELATVNPELPKLLPGLASMLNPDSISPFFEDLYRRKLQNLRENLSRLDQLLSRHNFYDCQTILQLKHPETKRRAVLIQAEMDVDADGSDSDRLPAGSGVSPNFQPFTSYRWAKKSERPNPYLPATDEKLGRYEAEYSAKATTAARKAELKNALARVRDEINSLKKFSYLIGATDPFIVIPGGLTAVEGTKVGDYAVVIHGGAIYPALVGDVGPSEKAGEASLRIAKEINPAATPLSRPESDLKATYLIFPGSGEKPWGPPDLDKIHARCEELVKEIGGASVPLHKWTNIIPPIPTPTPTPTPTPSPSATGSPDASASPGASPAASPEPTFAFPTPTPTSTPTPSPSPSPSSTPTPIPTPSAAPARTTSPRPTRRPTLPPVDPALSPSATRPASSPVKKPRP